MKIIEKLKMTNGDIAKYGPITIVAFGDSVTHGILTLNEISYETVYWNRLRKKILEIRDQVPVNVINSGIEGFAASQSIERMDSQVLAHNPDLVIVCFGLNDIFGELEKYLGALKTIFEKIQASGADLIFMTPNMMNTSLAEDTPSIWVETAKKTLEKQNSGLMDLYMESAVNLAKDMGVKVCDCYSKWKELSKTQDVTYLLANRINHPSREMHELFAQGLFDIIFEGEDLQSFGK